MLVVAARVSYRAPLGTQAAQPCAVLQPQLDPGAELEGCSHRSLASVGSGDHTGVVKSYSPLEQLSSR